MENINFLGEDDFLPTMETDNEEWFETCVKEDFFESFDGTKMHYYSTSPEDPKAVIVFVHGMGEFFGKHREYIWYLYRAGFKVFFMENRGHGYSGGRLQEMDLVHIDKYDTYVADLDFFIKNIVLPEKGKLHLFIIGHSMGGCISALYLEKHPGIIERAILTSPMMKMKSADFSPLVTELISIFGIITGRMKKISPGQKHFTPTPQFEGCSALSRARFDYQLNMRINDIHYQTAAASLGWALASIKATHEVIKNGGRIHIPVTVMTAGQDHLIAPEGYENFKKVVPQADFHPYETSRHEIFNADDETRKKYYADVIDTLTAWSAS